MTRFAFSLLCLLLLSLVGTNQLKPQQPPLQADCAAQPIETGKFRFDATGKPPIPNSVVVKAEN